GNTGGDRLELAADLDRGGGFHVEHVLGGSAAVQVEEEDAAGLAVPGAGRPALLRGQKVGQGETAAQDGQGPGGQGLPAREPIETLPGVAEHSEQGPPPGLWSRVLRAGGDPEK